MFKQILWTVAQMILVALNPLNALVFLMEGFDHDQLEDEFNDVV